MVDFSYKSPIELIYEDVAVQVAQRTENAVISAVQNVGVKVDKEELIRALEYDRNQYQQGYNDALRKETSSWEISEIKGFDEKPTNRFVASCRNCGFLTPDWRGRHYGLVGYYYCPQCGRRMESEEDEQLV